MNKLLVLLISIFVLSFNLSAYGQEAKTTDIKSVLDTPNAYIGKKITLAGYIKEKNFSDFKDWGFVLKDKSGRFITTYEFETRDVNFITHEIALRRAMRNNELVTVDGTIRKGPRLELETFETRGEVYNTNKMIWEYE